MKLSHENIQLIKDTTMLKAQVNILTIDSSSSEDKENKAPESEIFLRSVKDIKQELVDENQKNLVLEDRVAKMWQAFTDEQEKARGLEHDLTDHKKDLDSEQRNQRSRSTLGDRTTSKSQLGLGYNGKESAAMCLCMKRNHCTSK